MTLAPLVGVQIKEVVYKASAPRTLVHGLAIAKAHHVQVTETAQILHIAAMVSAHPEAVLGLATVKVSYIIVNDNILQD